MIKLTRKSIKRTFSKTFTILPNSAKGRGGVLTKGNVIKPHNADVFGNRQAKFCAVNKRAAGKNIMTA